VLILTFTFLNIWKIVGIETFESTISLQKNSLHAILIPVKKNILSNCVGILLCCPCIKHNHCNRSGYHMKANTRPLVTKQSKRWWYFGLPVCARRAF